MSSPDIKERDFVCTITEGAFSGQYDLTNVAIMGLFLAKALYVEQVDLQRLDKEHGDAALEQMLLSGLTYCFRSASAWEVITDIDELKGNPINLLEIGSITKVKGEYDYPRFLTAMCMVANLPLKQRIGIANVYLESIKSQVLSNGAEKVFAPVFKAMNKLGTFLFKTWWNTAIEEEKHHFEPFDDIRTEIPEDFGYAQGSNVLYYCTAFHKKFHKMACSCAQGIEDNFERYQSIFVGVRKDGLDSCPSCDVLEQALYQPKSHVVISYAILFLGMLAKSDYEYRIKTIDGLLTDYDMQVSEDMTYIQKVVPSALKVFAGTEQTLEALNLSLMGRFNIYVREFFRDHHNMIVHNHRFLDALCQLVDMWRVERAQRDKIELLEDKVEKLTTKVSLMNKAKKADKKKATADTGLTDATLEYTSNKMYEEMTAQLEALEQELESYRKKEYKARVSEIKDEEELKTTEINAAEEQLRKIEEIKKHDIVLVTGLRIPRLTEELGIEQRVIDKATNIGTVVSTSLTRECLGVYTKRVSHKDTMRVRLVADNNKSKFFFLNNTNFNCIVDKLYELITKTA